jgi:hypothetical protein
MISRITLSGLHGSTNSVQKMAISEVTRVCVLVQHLLLTLEHLLRLTRWS